MRCAICENLCPIDEDRTGLCGMVMNRGGVIVEKYPDSYLVVVPSAIESMPMLHYHPGSKFLQICTIGCNFRCPGCVSWVLTENPGSMAGAVHHMKPAEIVARALREGCRGIMFCFNEPAVSFFTFKKVAALAREKKLLVGCATNAYFTESSFKDLLQHIDFINIGIKGCTDDSYAVFGAGSAAPIFRNLRLSVESGVFTEVAAVYVKGREKEVLETANRVASISEDIPLQVMRFIPLGTADIADEPSIREAERLCGDIKKLLKHVYLFNSPGTSYLNTTCPECGEVLVRRGFNGPMCAHVSDFKRDGICSCGFRLPFAGAFEKDAGVQVIGFYGGYKTIHSLESIQTILAFIGERDPGVITSVLQRILETGFIGGLYEKTKEIDSYLNTLDHFAELAGRTREAGELRKYLERQVSIIRTESADAERPLVYFALGHPLIAVFGDKFECNLVELAGGRCVNKDIARDNTPGMTIPEATLRRLNPEVILVSGVMGCSASDIYEFCIHRRLNIRAVTDKRIYSTYPYPASIRPDWVLGLMQIANVLHPERFRFDLEKLADEFYTRFLGVRLDSVRECRSPAHPAIRPRADASNTA